MKDGDVSTMWIAASFRSATLLAKTSVGKRRTVPIQIGWLFNMYGWLSSRVQLSKNIERLVVALDSKGLAQSQARKKAPKRIPNSIATNWKIASFISVESVSSNGILRHQTHCSGIYDEGI